MDAENYVILWVDLTGIRGRNLPPGIAELFAAYQVHNTRHIDATIRKVKPLVACFEYDYPDNDGLAALTQTQHTHPTLPILVISARYSEALAMCALRARVWDFIVKPYPIADTVRAVIVHSTAVAHRAINQARSLPLQEAQGKH